MKFDTIQQQKYFYLNGNFHFSFSSKVFRASLSVYGRWLNSYFWISRRLTVNIPGHPYNSRRKQGMPPYHSKGRIIISFVTKFTGTLTISVLFRGPSFSFKDDENDGLNLWCGSYLYLLKFVTGTFLILYSMLSHSPKKNIF